MRLIISILLMLSMVNVFASNAACLNLKKLETNAKQLIEPYEDQFCQFEIKPKHIEWLIHSGLPMVMNKEFLEVEPPPNWDFFATALINQCFREGDICSRDVQEKFAQCAMAQLPLLLLQFGPWLTDNCEKLNNSLILHWKEKKMRVKNVIDGFLQEVINGNK